ncbi:hypothetical protein HRR83_000463 [Exophiala dermatitidis]|uniref:HAUS augmin-like complex subunit 4 n=2 Tax=Exophiala dermatitidis TaxID=5970 RepID=H6C9C2_EXODN|nr:uncharacterized protein HMPREF1120_08642 [Exophiala dermatitidis NIH/UT8656]KAJ4524830.1 hypothetical protein HRR75_000421 [Exophiala dermatitidis]EHY60692.1 hypothetical protein HMPREF1120_08642 [Exophiala dermatitidis NIH/UT8656]KAJ4527710.1 hypothetical protein HRR74_000465 [Exophiala dermatitidis]KAJ4528346.1 hypothetical protein HRR73_000969 [Exophiala dermatitidis]KAJ4531296.1 hypothetical protein HRR76_008962 [Exophiala dermatitidis]
MIPPLPESTLTANPEFARLWEQLTTEILRSDASRRNLGNRWDGDRDGDGGEGSGEDSLGAAMTGLRLDGGTGYERYDGVEGPDPDDDDEDVEDEDEDEDEDVGEQQQWKSLDADWGQRLPDRNLPNDRIRTGKKPKTKTASFEERLQQHRVNRMKAYILRSLLADVTYCGSMGDRSLEPDEVEADRIGERQSTTTTTTLAHWQSQISKSTTETAKAQQSELRDLLLLISAYLDVSTSMSLNRSSTKQEFPTRLAAESESGNKEDQTSELQLHHLLEEEIARFKDSLPLVGELLGSRLVEVESMLEDIAALATTTTTTAKSTTTTRTVRSQTSGESRPLLSNHIEGQLSQLRHLQSDVLAKRLSDVTCHSQTLLALQRELNCLQLQHLERSKHGVLHRHSMARLGFLKTVAEAMELKTRVAVLETKRDLGRNRTRGDGVVDSDTDGLAQRLRDMDREEVEADERLDALERLLEEYDAVLRPEEQQKTGGGGEQIMQKLGARYREIEGEMESVKRDIERLGRVAG